MRDRAANRQTNRQIDRETMYGPSHRSSTRCSVVLAALRFRTVEPVGNPAGARFTSVYMSVHERKEKTEGRVMAEKERKKDEDRREPSDRRQRLRKRLRQG